MHFFEQLFFMNMKWINSMIRKIFIAFKLFYIKKGFAFFFFKIAMSTLCDINIYYLFLLIYIFINCFKNFFSSSSFCLFTLAKGAMRKYHLQSWRFLSLFFSIPPSSYRIFPIFTRLRFSFSLSLSIIIIDVLVMCWMREE